SDEDFNSKIETVTADFKASSTITFSPSTGTEWATGSYYKFLFNVTVSATKNKFVEFKTVEMYETVSASTTYNVSYDANGGTGEVSDGTEYTAGQSATVLSGETLSKENYAFAGWNTEADGSGTAYAPGASMVVDGNTTLYAQWDRTHYAVTYDPNGGSGEAFVEKVAVADAGSYVAASGSSFTNGSYPFDGWATSASGAVVYAVGDSVPLTKDLTLYAHWQIPAVEKIVSNDGLYDGMTVLIGDAKGTKVMGAQNTNNRAAIPMTDGIPGSGFVTLTLGIEDTVDGVFYTFYDGVEKGYLYAASSGSNYLRTESTLDDNGRWAVDSSKSSVVAQGENTRNVMQLNGTLFSCYDSAKYVGINLYAFPQTITDEQVANTFIKKYMHMVSAPVGETGTGKCVSESWYATAKEAFNKLTEDQRLIVTDNADVYARLQAWAVANGDEMTGDLILASKSAPFRSEAGVSQEKNAAAISLIALAGGASAGALVFLLRKKKQDR
ncbi:MAG: InlB B-repeat-containing protein, partial [Candidatus Enteromonas sp.]